MTATATMASGDAAMRRFLEPMIRAALSDGAPVTHVDWARFPLATSYAAHVATAARRDGRHAKLFVKDFRSTVRPKDAPAARREREVRLYGELLGDAELGTARYYGSLLERSLGWQWLLLEFVDGTPVGYLDIARSWAPAVRALARLHGRFARRGDALARCGFLVQHTPAFFWSKVEFATSAVRAIAPERQDELSRIVARYAPIVELMAAQPRTLIHGGCRSTNILVEVAGDPARVCIIDWEEAAFGAPLYDLAYLLDGIEPPLLDALLDAYAREAAEYGIALPPRREAQHVMDCFRLHMILLMLGQAVLKRYGPTDVTKLLAVGSRLAERVGGHARP